MDATGVAKAILSIGWTSMTEPLPGVVVKAAEMVERVAAEARREALEEAGKACMAMADACEEAAHRITTESAYEAYSVEAEDELAYAQTLREAHDRIRRLASQETP